MTVTKRAPFDRRLGLSAWLGFALCAWSVDSFIRWASGERSLLVHTLLVFYPVYFTCICIHDAVHGVLWRSRRGNDLGGFLMSLVIGLPFPLLRYTHLRHHRVLGAHDDPEAAVYRAAWWQLPLVLPVVPLIYARSFPRLSRRLRLLTLLHSLLVGSAALWLGPLVLGWALPAVLAIAWFGFTTVYVPHSQYSGSLMKLLQLHSGWHDDHHADVRFPYPQYAQLRAWNLAQAQQRDRVTELLARPVTRSSG